jgi:RNA polymerase sigma-70 factor (ECF subfamily)
MRRGTLDISGCAVPGQAGMGFVEPGAPGYGAPPRLLPFGTFRCFPRTTGAALATRKEMSDFLASVERRAFKQSVYAVHEEEAALDIVQDAMLRLAEKYATRPPEELPLLFQRILQNAIRDHFRRQKVRSTWTTLLSNLGMGGDGDEVDPLETMEIAGDPSVPTSPADQLEQVQVMAAIEDAVQSLPQRQREAFMLRYWEELDVSETAKVMGCSEGSVKTHCSRATHALAKVLRAKGITL